MNSLAQKKTLYEEAVKEQETVVMPAEESAETEIDEAENLTYCERLVIKVIWENEEPLSIKDIAAKVNERFERGWKLQTVSCLLGHLVKKGYLTMERRGRSFFYYPLVTEEQDRTRKLTEMPEFWCEGKPDEFLTCFLMNRLITEEEKENMRKIINALD